MHTWIFSAFLAATAVIAAAPPSEEEIRRRPDSEWDYVIKGSDVAAAAQFSDSEIVPEYIGDYNLRAKNVDPRTLNIDTVKQISGYLDDTKADKHLFYWFFESRNDPKKDPVVLWLNGGPGCSSFLGLFEAHGPSKLPNPDLKPVRNPYSWNNNASVIYIDQPVNTGFSYSKSNVDTSLAAAKDLASLLTLFFTKFPEYSTQDFHISGQSYAGHWIPSTGSEIVTKNYTKINLKSLLIGNGLSDPLSQYKHYRPMACGEGGQKSVLSDSDCKSMDRGLPDCEKQIKSCYDGGGTSACRNATTNCNNLIFPTYNKSGRSHYDIRIKSGGEPATYAVDFMNKQSTKEALGVEVSRKYQKCSTSVYNSILGSGDWMQPRHRLLPDILAKIPVLYYSGDVDFICNWLGNQALTENLKWPGQSGFNSAKLQGLTLDGKEYGKVKHHQKFAFIRIYEAGHSVALNQPRPALDMLNRWLRGEWQS